MFKIVHYTTTDGEYVNIIKASEILAERFPQRFEFVFFGRNSKRPKNEIYEELTDADFALFTLMGNNFSFDDVEGLLTYMKEKGVAFHIQSSVMREEHHHREMSGVSNELYEQIKAFILNGGVNNYVALFMMLANHFKKMSLPEQTVENVPLDGLMTEEGVVTSLEEFYRVSPRMDTRIGVLFYRSQFIAGNTKVIEAFMAEGKKQGVNIIPLYFYGAVPTNAGNIGLERAILEMYSYEGAFDVQMIINFAGFSLTTGQTIMDDNVETMLKKLDIPVVKSYSTTQNFQDWSDNPNGMSPIDYTLNLIMAEYDGQINGQMVSTKEMLEMSGQPFPLHMPLDAGIKNMVEMAINYARLGQISNQDKKISIILHNYPAGDANIGTASGLDTMASVVKLIERLKAEGYTIDKTYQDGDELLADLLAHGTNEERWQDLDNSERDCIYYPLSEYLEWMNKAENADIKALVERDFDRIPLLKGSGENAQILIAGLRNGNLFIGIQPTRALLIDDAKTIHDTALAPHHQYIAFYRYQKHYFKADCYIHVGTHGTVEFLPGKAVGQTSRCFPNLLIDNLPNFYFYTIKNPGEGAIAKRRAFACIIDYLVPKLKFVEGYDELDSLERALADYERAESEGFESSKPYYNELVALIKQLNLQSELELAEDVDFDDINFDELVEPLWHYLYEIKTNYLTIGLHTLGEAQTGADLIDTIMVLTRINNGETPSLIKTFASAKGIDYDYALEHMEEISNSGKRLGEVLTSLQNELRELLFELFAEPKKLLTSEEIKSTAQRYAVDTSEMLAVLDFVNSVLTPKLLAVSDEIDYLVKGLAGRFIPPGKSGNVSRGGVDILPTGRNFYTVDPRCVPSKSAWKTGVKLGDAVLRDYYLENGKYPESVAIVLWGLSTIRSKGDDLAEIYYLLGLRPVWDDGNGRVKSLEIIPIEELGRPRIDVTIRISGVFRDMFPNQINMLDKAIEMIATLDEPKEQNFLAAHFKEDLANDIENTDESEKRTNALARIFGASFGNYGTGVSHAIDDATWETAEDLSDIFMNWGSFAYGRKQKGVFMRSAFENRLKRVEATVQNATSRETDILSVDDYYQYHGGLAAAVKAVRKESPKMYCGDTSNPDKIKLKTADKELKYVYRSRVLNDNWIAGMKEHGYKGAGDISKMFKYALGWSATVDIVDKWMYDELANKYILDEEMKEWFAENNPQALFNMIETLLEANQRDLWAADAEMLVRLQNILLFMEARLE